MSNIDVICIGAAVVDIPLRPVGPEIFEGESCPIERIAMITGGDALNEAIVISRLGYSSAVMGKIGDDAPGQFILKTCIENDVNTDNLIMDPEVDTAITIALVTEKGERTFVTNRNSSLWKTSVNDLKPEAFNGIKILSMDSIFSHPLLTGSILKDIFFKAKSAGVIVCADMVHPKKNETLEDIKDALNYVDYFFPNYDEAVLLSGEKELNKIAEKFLNCGVKNIVIKIGSRGCYVANKNGFFVSPAVKGTKVIDTIGAGDNFAAGFITALLDGKNLEECAKFANATASISVESEGATAGVKDKNQVIERIENSNPWNC